MDTRKLEILKSDKKAYLSLNKPGEGGTIIANMDLDGIYKPEDMRELVKRWNAYNELLRAVELLQDTFVHDDQGRTKGNQAKTDIIKYNDHVRDALNEVREIVYKIEKS